MRLDSDSSTDWPFLILESWMWAENLRAAEYRIHVPRLALALMSGVAMI